MFSGKVSMKIEVFPQEPQVCCLECQHLHQPNPDEDSLICLRTLQPIVHEIDYEIECSGFEYIDSYWEPVYVASEDIYG
jgi:hypothetical protein